MLADLDEAEDTIEVAANFTTHVVEYEGEAGDQFVQEIRGEILVSRDGAIPDPAGEITAEVFNVLGLMYDGTTFIVYDSRRGQLTEAFDLLYSYGGASFRPRALRAVGRDVDDEPTWHVHISGLTVEPAWRGQRVGLRALRLLRRHLTRTSLIVTAKAYPEERGATRPPTTGEIKRLVAYYRSDPELGFVPLGSQASGWLIGNWSRTDDW